MINQVITQLYSQVNCCLEYIEETSMLFIKKSLFKTLWRVCFHPRLCYFYSAAKIVNNKL